MVYVVVASVVGRHVLEWVEGKRIAAVIVDSLDGTASEKPHALAHSHASDEIADSSAKGVEEKSFKRVIIQRAVSIRNVETVVSGVERSCMLLVDDLTAN